MPRITLETLQQEHLLRQQQALRLRKGAERLLAAAQQVVLEISP